MRILTGVVAHTNRQTMATRLGDRIGAAYVSIDDGTIGAGANHLRVWQHLIAEHDGDWCLVIEDDAVPVVDFTTHLHAALTQTPSPITSLYLGTGRPPHWQPRIRDAIEKAQANDAAFITSTHLLHAVAVAVQTPLVPDMLNLLERKKYLPIDEAISLWARRQQLSVAYTYPSLVEHRDTATVMKHRDGQPRTESRRAWHVGQRSDWNNHTVTMRIWYHRVPVRTFTMSTTQHPDAIDDLVDWQMTESPAAIINGRIIKVGYLGAWRYAYEVTPS